jgi:hypothetical protein
MVFAGIKVPDTTLVRDAMELARGLSEPFLFNHVMRSWLFGVVLSEGAEHAPDAELLAVAAVLHDLGLTDRYTGANRFEVDGANAARVFLSDQGISALQMQLVWDAIALHTTPTLALHKEPEVVMVHSGIAVDVLGVGLDRIPQDKQRAILSEFPRLAFKTQFKGCLCNVVRQKPMTTIEQHSQRFRHSLRRGVRASEFCRPRGKCAIFRIADQRFAGLGPRLTRIIRRDRPFL